MSRKKFTFKIERNIKRFYSSTVQYVYFTYLQNNTIYILYLTKTKLATPRHALLVLSYNLSIPNHNKTNKFFNCKAKAEPPLQRLLASHPIEKPPLQTTAKNEKRN